ncbi:MAG TPA: HD domain-containing phosphohydrolase [Candidatus Xenobia bacterium]|nr:HD domain-containing phosphohydrolase [Candidatus Xenobia bacterium]
MNSLPARITAAVEPSLAGGAGRARARVLVVDDLEANRRLLTSLLEPLGYEIFTAADGREALEQTEQHPPDVILLDVMMPEMDGLEVCARLKSDPRTRLIPIVVITALHGEPEKVRAIEAGADDFLNKPFSKAELLARVRALLRLKRFTDELEFAETVLISLGLAVESRDPHTEGHCQRLARISVELGRRLALDEPALVALRRGGYLHDIGKIATPDAVLLKNGPLTDEERRVMRRHTEIGEQICRPLRSFEAVLPIIRSHHEHWDGSGYPDGLSGEEIPLLARLLQLADVYDALRSHRPYKPPQLASAALEQMQREAARGWYDPRLLEFFFRVHDDVVGELYAPR